MDREDHQWDRQSLIYTGSPARGRPGGENDRPGAPHPRCRRRPGRGPGERDQVRPSGRGRTGEHSRAGPGLAQYLHAMRRRLPNIHRRDAGEVRFASRDVSKRPGSGRARPRVPDPDLGSPRHPSVPSLAIGRETTFVSTPDCNPPHDANQADGTRPGRPASAERRRAFRRRSAGRARPAGRDRSPASGHEGRPGEDRLREAGGAGAAIACAGSSRTPRSACARQRPLDPGAETDSHGPLQHRTSRQPPGRRDQPLPAPARAQPGRLVSLGPRGDRQGEGRGQADLPLDRLLGLPLVPRHGARELRGPGHRRPDERALRQRQGRPRGAARPRPDLHGGRAGDDRARRLADVGLPHPRPPALLRRDVLPPTDSRGMPGFPRDPAERPPRLEGAARRDRLLGGGDDRAPPLGGDRPGREGGARRQAPRRGGPQPGPELRLDARRIRPGAQVPPLDGPPGPPPSTRPDRRCPCAPHGPPHARQDGTRRHLRPSRRRLRALLDRRALARPALREDALRQRPARLGLPGGVPGDRRPRICRGWPARRWTTSSGG